MRRRRFRPSLYALALVPVLLLLLTLASALASGLGRTGPGGAGQGGAPRETGDFEGAIKLKGGEVAISVRGSGGPTVIFEPGFNEPWQTFSGIRDVVAGRTRTFLYNRGDFAQIEASRGTAPSSAAQVALLHELLKKARVEGPYLIVAHSLGAFNARLFAARYPGEVAGIVFVEGSSEETPFSGDMGGGEMPFSGIMRSCDEVQAANAADALRKVPITVLVADYAGRGFVHLGWWMDRQEWLAGRSEKSRLEVVGNSGHLLQSERPEAVVKAVEAMLDSLGLPAAPTKG